jgi:hypothetical protein
VKKLSKKIAIFFLDCHPATATLSNRYHSNRLVLLFPTVPLPPSHCHSPRHNIQFYHIIAAVNFPTNCRFFFLTQPQLGQYCHYHILTTTIRTASTSSFQRSHCHPATATPRATRTRYLRKHGEGPVPQIPQQMAALRTVLRNLVFFPKIGDFIGKIGRVYRGNGRFYVKNGRFYVKNGRFYEKMEDFT